MASHAPDRSQRPEHVAARKDVDDEALNRIHMRWQLRGSFRASLLAETRKQAARTHLVTQQVLEVLSCKYAAAVKRNAIELQCRTCLDISETHSRLGALGEAESWAVEALDIAVEESLPETVLFGKYFGFQPRVR
jgi:hypothetical protein